MRARRISRIGIVLVALYLVSYFCLSRVSLQIIKADGVEEFYYVPFSLKKISMDRKCEYAHLVGSYFFYPIWAIDHFVFGGPSYGTSLPLEGVEGHQ